MMNHPYYKDIHEKFGKKKILAYQQDSIRGQVSYWKEQAIILSVALGIASLALLICTWLTEDDRKVCLLVSAICAGVLLVPLCPAVMFWTQKKKYAYILGIESPKTEPKQMHCTKVKLWIKGGKDGVGVVGVWLFSDTGDKYLYIYPHKCHDRVMLTLFPENKVRKQIKATFTGRFVRFSCYEGTNVIQGFSE